jgi:hypothetical protein
MHRGWFRQLIAGVVKQQEVMSISLAARQDAFKAPLNGKDLPEASQKATMKVAKKYRMAYYEGKDGVLKLVVD